VIHSKLRVTKGGDKNGATPVCSSEGKEGGSGKKSLYGNLAALQVRVRLSRQLLPLMQHEINQGLPRGALFYSFISGVVLTYFLYRKSGCI